MDLNLLGSRRAPKERMSHFLLVQCVLALGSNKGCPPPTPNPRVNPWVWCPVIAHVAGSELSWVEGELAQKALSRPGRGF